MRGGYLPSRGKEFNRLRRRILPSLPSTLHMVGVDHEQSKLNAAKLRATRREVRIQCPELIRGLVPSTSTTPTATSFAQSIKSHHPALPEPYEGAPSSTECSVGDKAIHQGASSPISVEWLLPYVLTAVDH